MIVHAHFLALTRPKPNLGRSSAYRPTCATLRVSLTNKHRIAVCSFSLLIAILSFASSPKAAGSDCLVVHDGKMMMMKDGKPTVPMRDSMTMSDGTVVMTDGTVKMKDGTERHMKDGEMIMMDGHLMKGERSKMGEGSN
jgi:hypothetical protein